MPQQANQALPAGYVLNGYRIEKPLSSGGFSIVYLARDESGTPFAIKEYLPASLPLRTDSLEIKLDEESSPIFRHGLKCFFEEGRALAMITHPNVVRVENFFRANDTCYMVMQYVRGRTLQFHIQRHRHEFTEGFIRKIFIHLMNGCARCTRTSSSTSTSSPRMSSSRWKAGPSCSISARRASRSRKRRRS
jgi:serine/threonine protein kinase